LRRRALLRIGDSAEGRAEPGHRRSGHPRFLRDGPGREHGEARHAQRGGAHRLRRWRYQTAPAALHAGHETLAPRAAPGFPQRDFAETPGALPGNVGAHTYTDLIDEGPAVPAASPEEVG